MPTRFSRNRSQQRDHGRAVEITELRDRLDRTERRLLQVENALRGVTREIDHLSVDGPCLECNRSLMLVSDDTMYCPQCGYRHPM